MNTPTTSTQRSDLYTRVTERVVADLERGARPWVKPWTSRSPRITRPRRHNGMPYRGINVLLLWNEAIDRGYSAPLWMTYRQPSSSAGMFGRASTARRSCMPTALSGRKPTPPATTSSARSRS
jgi:antirestriction protein ArdC